MFVIWWLQLAPLFRYRLVISVVVAAFFSWLMSFGHCVLCSPSSRVRTIISPPTKHIMCGTLVKLLGCANGEKHKNWRIFLYKYFFFDFLKNVSSQILQNYTITAMWYGV
jgi:hypothetical protein